MLIVKSDWLLSSRCEFEGVRGEDWENFAVPECASVIVLSSRSWILDVKIQLCKIQLGKISRLVKDMISMTAYTFSLEQSRESETFCHLVFRYSLIRL